MHNNAESAWKIIDCDAMVKDQNSTRIIEVENIQNHSQFWLCIAKLYLFYLSLLFK